MESTLWFIGKNECNECGLDINVVDWKCFRCDQINKTDVDQCRKCNNTYTPKVTEFAVNNLTESEWSKMIKCISCIDKGYGFNIYTVLTNDDEFVVFGFMREIEELLPYETNTFYMMPSSIIQICLKFFGNNYTQYWSAGGNSHGQCAHGHNNKVKQIEEIKGVDNIFKICSGNDGYSILWITIDGKLYLNGANDRIQLGMSLEDDAVACIKSPVLSSFFEKKSLKCIGGACGDNCCMVLCNDGSVWSSGFSMCGTLGHGANIIKCEKFTKIEALQEYKVIDVIIGCDIAFFLDINGNIYSCGYSRKGSLGLSKIHANYGYGYDVNIPTKIDYFDKNNVNIIKIECGGYHVMALDENGKMYVWGSNINGECGIENNNNNNDRIWCPRMIKDFSTKIIKDIKCGCNHSGAISIDDKFYLWGQNRYNQCCMINTKKDKVFKPNCINKYVQNITNTKNILDMTLGDETTMILVQRT